MLSLSESAQADTTVKVSAWLRDGSNTTTPVSYDLTIPAGRKTVNFTVDNTLGDDAFISDKAVVAKITSATDGTNAVFTPESDTFSVEITDSTTSSFVSLEWWDDDNNIYIRAYIDDAPRGDMTVYLSSSQLSTGGGSLFVDIPAGQTKSEPLVLPKPSKAWSCSIHAVVYNSDKSKYECLTIDKNSISG